MNNNANNKHTNIKARTESTAANEIITATH